MIGKICKSCCKGIYVNSQHKIYCCTCGKEYNEKNHNTDDPTNPNVILDRLPIRNPTRVSR